MNSRPGLPSSSSSSAHLPLPPPPLAPPPSGSFKLKIKLAGPPSAPAPNPAPPPRPAGAAHGDEEEQEDQLASSNDSLSSPPPQPPPLPPPPKRSKAHDPPNSFHTVKKRKSVASFTNPPAQSASAHPPAIPYPADHFDSFPTAPDSELSSYSSEIPPKAPKPTKPKPSSSQAPKQRLRVSMAPLTDAELLTAAATTLPLPLEPAPVEPLPIKKKKKKTASSAVLKKPLRKPSAALAPLIETPLLPMSGEPPMPPQAEQKSVILTIKAPGKSKGRKTSKLAQAVTTAPPDPFTHPPATQFLPPQPRMQHNYDLGPPPPPPVPAYRSMPVGPMPRSQGPFLPAQSLDKRTPKVRAWKKIRREVVGVSGIPFWIWTYVGDDHSNYMASKQNKAVNVGTPLPTQPSNAYFQPHHPSYPASASSSHHKASPIRTSAAAARAKYTIPETVSNLGGPALPASFRRPLAGSPLTTDVTSFTASPLISRTKQAGNPEETLPRHQSDQVRLSPAPANEERGASPSLIRLPELTIPNGL